MFFKEIININIPYQKVLIGKEVNLIKNQEDCKTFYEYRRLPVQTKKIENMQGKMCSKAIRKNSVLFNSCHGKSSILFSSNTYEIFNVILFYFYD